MYAIKREEHHTHNTLQNKNKQKRQIKTLHVENVDLSTSQNKCPAYGKSCNNCGKNNNFSKCCKAEATKKKGQREEIKKFFVDSVEICNAVKAERIV